MSHPTLNPRLLLAACWVRLTASCRRFSSWAKRKRLRLLQRAEMRLRRRLEKNQQKQVKLIRHPLYQEHLQKTLLQLEQSQGHKPPPFDLHRLL